ncbi:MAG: cadherin-like beta sandwich domain-containing protein [Lachnospiraceae bacterium]|nr:cadherin-like beta sandwich domain-containing protein [Lachnospiraceae bacterium]
MRNIFKKWCCRLVLVCMMAVFVPFQSLAATARIAFSDPSGQVGSEISVTMKFTSTDGTVLGNTDVMLAYDANMLEFINETENASGGAGAIRVWTGLEGKTEMVTTLRFRALQAGTSQITISSWEGYDNDGAALTSVKEGSSKITIAALETSSDDAKLQVLQVSPGTLDPAFSPDTENYTVSVGMDVEKLTISAKTNNDKAVVAVEGGSDLQPGENTVVCKVTAENGTTVKNYTITVNKVEGGASESQTAAEASEGTAAAEPEVLAELDVTAKKIRIIELPDGVKVPDYLKESSIAIGDVKVKGWTSTLEEKPTYCVFYGMNEDGKQDFYRYDLQDKTVQRYFQNESAGAISQQQYDEVVAEHDKIVDDYNRMMYLAIGLGAVCLVLLAALVIVLRMKRADREPDFKEPQDRPETKRPRSAQGKKLSKEERYMMGVEDEYEEEDPEPEDYLPEKAADPVPSVEDSYMADSHALVQEAEPFDDMEKVMEKNLAKEAAAAAKEPEDSDEEDDFEFFDLDE